MSRQDSSVIEAAWRAAKIEEKMRRLEDKHEFVVFTLAELRELRTLWRATHPRPAITPATMETPLHA